MATNKSASYEARLKNNKDLVISVSGYSKYNPTSEDIKKENYSGFLKNTEAAMTELKNSIGSLSTERKINKELFENMVNTARAVRSETGELRGTDSNEYGQVNSIVKLITGENVSKHSMKKKEVNKNLKDGEEEPDSNSVSQLDNKSKLGNFRLLNGLLRSFTFYLPDEKSISIASLEAMETVLTESLERIAEKENAFTNRRSAIMHYFNDKGGLRDRAKRAKMHVKRQYGNRSPEFKALVNKNY
ncbi:MAG TPA: hypothetical protein PKA90_12780 [Ignavibacteria bacterium]|nr:hypothetical protein [Ignavibacteria bacterium]HMR41294.1 hypothetical protein [Ignavibacteria bacterium]